MHLTVYVHDGAESDEVFSTLDFRVVIESGRVHSYSAGVDFAHDVVDDFLVKTFGVGFESDRFVFLGCERCYDDPRDSYSDIWKNNGAEVYYWNI